MSQPFPPVSADCPREGKMKLNDKVLEGRYALLPTNPDHRTRMQRSMADALPAKWKAASYDGFGVADDARVDPCHLPRRGLLARLGFRSPEERPVVLLDSALARDLVLRSIRGGWAYDVD